MPKKTFWKWSLRAVAVFVALTVGILGLLYWSSSRQLSRIELLRTKLDAEDPGWRFHENKARRKGSLPPDRQNITLRVMHLSNESEKTFNQWLEKNENWLPNEPRTGLPTPGKLAEAKKLKAEIQPTIDEALTTRLMTSGGHVQEMGLGLDLKHYNRLRYTATLLRFNAQVHAADNQGDDAILNCQAILNLTNGFNDDPLIIGGLTRCAIRGIAVNTTESVLATTGPHTSLELLQSALAREAESPVAAISFRGERGLLDAHFDELKQSGFLGNLLNRLSPLQLSEQHLEGLEMRTRELEIVRGPSQEWLKKFHEMPKPDPSRVLIAPLVSSDEKALKAFLRSTAKLNALVGGIASERYRQAHGRWPKSWEEIPKDIFAEPPTDPYTGKPVRLMATPTGVRVYAVGEDETDNDGTLADTVTHGTDIGVELWSPEHRRKPTTK